MVEVIPIAFASGRIGFYDNIEMRKGTELYYIYVGDERKASLEKTGTDIINLPTPISLLEVNYILEKINDI